MGHKAQAVIDHSFPHEVVPTLVTFIDGLEQEHHVLVELPSGVPLAHLVNAFDNDLVHYLAGVPAD